MSRLFEGWLAAIIGEWEAVGLRYTARQLGYALCRRLYPLPRWATLRLPFTLPAPLAPERIDAAIDEHINLCQAPAGLLMDANRASDLRRDSGRWDALFALTPRPPLPHAGEGELLPQRRDGLPPAASCILHPASFQHALPRLLLCEDAELAAMLRANNLHHELACPILAVAEALPLPAWLAAMLAGGGAQVALLHDASPAGLALAADLPGRLGLPPDLRYRPIGLRPAHALRLHLVARRVGGGGGGPSLPTAAPPAAAHRGESPLSRVRERGTGGEGQRAYPNPELSAMLTPAERRWLVAGWTAEAQAIPPLRLLRALKRIMVDTPAPPSLLARLRGARELGFMTWPEAQ